MKKAAAIFIGCLLLAGCGGGGESEVACVSTYWNETFGLCLPEGWNVLSAEELQLRGMPTQVAAGFQAAEGVSGQFPTITATVEPLPGEVTLADYAKASREAVARRKDYRKIDERKATIDGEETTIHVFSAQPLTTQPQLRFYQLPVPHEGKGYVFTAALPLTVTDTTVQQVLTILGSVTFKAPEEKKE